MWTRGRIPLLRAALLICCFKNTHKKITAKKHYTGDWVLSVQSYLTDLLLPGEKKRLFSAESCSFGLKLIDKPVRSFLYHGFILSFPQNLSCAFFRTMELVLWHVYVRSLNPWEKQLRLIIECLKTGCPAAQKMSKLKELMWKRECKLELIEESLLITVGGMTAFQFDLILQEKNGEWKRKKRREDQQKKKGKKEKTIKEGYV